MKIRNAMEENITQKEFEQMRSQIELLKKKISEEEFISKKVLRTAMRKNIKDFNHDAMIINIVAIITIPCSAHILLDAGFSRYFICGTIIFLLGCMAKNILLAKGMETDTIMNENLVSAAEKVIAVKEKYTKSLKTVIPFLILWIAWFFTEIANMAGNDNYAISLACGGALGAVIGGFLGFRKHKKALRTLDEIILQIEALKKEDEESHI